MTTTGVGQFCTAPAFTEEIVHAIQDRFLDCRGDKGATEDEVIDLLHHLDQTVFIPMRMLQLALQGDSELHWDGHEVLYRMNEKARRSMERRTEWLDD